MKIRVIHSSTGKVEEVSEGYARNYLIPRGLAKVATHREEQLSHDQQAQKARRADLEVQTWTNIAQQLKNRKVEVVAKAATSGKLFERIHTSDILMAVSHQLQLRLEESWVHLEPIKQLGEHQVKIIFPNSLTTAFHVTVKEKK